MLHLDILQFQSGIKKKKIHKISPLMSICLEKCKFMPLSVFYSLSTYPKCGLVWPFFYIFLHYLLSVKIVIIVTFYVFIYFFISVIIVT
jgi:hypothetical protein